MRTISGALQTAQDAVTNIPYIRFVLNSPTFTGGVPDVSYNYSSSTGRLRRVEHSEEAYNDYATVILNNSDLAVVADLTGYWVEIGYGYDTDGAGTYASSPTSRLWVKSQMDFSAEGKLYTALELGGVWDVLRETLIRVGDPPFYRKYEDPETGNTYFTSPDGTTVYWLINAVINELDDDNFDFGLVGLVGAMDGIIDSFSPKFEVNTISPFEDALALVRRLIEMTKCYLRLVADIPGETGDTQYVWFELVYPQDTDAYDAEYWSTQQHYFYEYMERTNLSIPNHIILFANAGADGLWTDIITVEAPLAEDQPTDPQITKYRDVVEIHTAELIDNPTDAQNRADAILARKQAELLSGRLIIRHDCRLELYDRVAIYDSRGT